MKSRRMNVSCTLSTTLGSHVQTLLCDSQMACEPCLVSAHNLRNHSPLSASPPPKIVRLTTTRPYLVPALKGGDGEEGEKRPHEIVEVDHTRLRVDTVVFAAFTLCGRDPSGRSEVSATGATKPRYTPSPAGVRGVRGSNIN